MSLSKCKIYMGSQHSPMKRSAKPKLQNLVEANHVSPLNLQNDTESEPPINRMWEKVRRREFKEKEKTLIRLIGIEKTQRNLRSKKLERVI